MKNRLKALRLFSTIVWRKWHGVRMSWGSAWEVSQFIHLGKEPQPLPGSKLVLDQEEPDWDDPHPDLPPGNYSYPLF